MKYLLGACCMFLTYSAAAQQKIYVSTKGADNAAGTVAKPLKTLSAAMLLANQQARTGKVKAMQILLGEGTYFIDTTIEITEKNWQANIPLTIQASGHVIIHGGRILPANALKPLKDTARFIPAMRNKIKQVNLQEAGIANIGKLRPVGFSRAFGPAWMEAFFNGKPGRLARWPNDSTVMIGKLIDSGAVPRNGDYTIRGGKFTYEGTDRPSRWKSPATTWIFGYFMWGYADDAVPLKSINTETKTITTVLPTMYGFGTGKPWRAWYAYNLPEEIDLPGEYYVDTDTRTLYCLPPDTLKQLELSVLEEPMLAIEGVSNVRIEGIHFTCSRGMGIYMERTQGVRINNCTFSNLGMMAVNMGKGTYAENEHVHAQSGTPKSRIVGTIIQHIYANSTFDREAGTDNGIENCVIFQTGAGGIFLSGGNRLTLEPGRSFVRNCKISNYNRIERSYRPGIWMIGVGNLIANCEIFDAPASAIFMHGNDHIVEYNNIHNVAMEVDDMGAVYFGRNPSEQGIIVRYNYLHHIGGKHKTMAVYHDDGACGMQVYGNVFYKAATVAGFIGGGMDNTYTNNIFIDQKYASHIDDRLKSWASAMLLPNGLYRERLDLVNYTQPPYATKYPHLKNYFEDDPAMPKRNTFSNNLLVNVFKRTEGHEEWLPFTKDNLDVKHDPGFINYAGEDFRLKKDAEVWKQLPGFKQIPFEKIGYRPAKKIKR